MCDMAGQGCVAVGGCWVRPGETVRPAVAWAAAGDQMVEEE